MALTTPVNYHVLCAALLRVIPPQETHDHQWVESLVKNVPEDLSEYQRGHIRWLVHRYLTQEAMP